MKSIAIAAMLALFASGAQAGAIELTKPLAGATLNEAGIGMSVYWTRDAKDGAEVVATFTSLNGEYRPRRMRMRLTDGDKVSFALPGRSDAYYTFERSEDLVRVTGQCLANMLASQ